MLQGKMSNGDMISINLKKSYWFFGIILILLNIIVIFGSFFGEKHVSLSAADVEPIVKIIESKVGESQEKIEQDIATSIYIHNQDPKAHPEIAGILNGIKQELAYMNKQLEEIKRYETKEK